MSRLLPVVLLLLLVPCAFAGELPRSPLAIESGGAVHRFEVEVADTPEARAEGLMYRRELAADHGMLFIFAERAKQTMWMKNTFIPLDMLFLSPDGTVLHLVERTVPHSTDIISSRLRVQAVLELPGGTVERLGLRVGDKVRHARLGGG